MQGSGSREIEHSGSRKHSNDSSGVSPNGGRQRRVLSRAGPGGAYSDINSSDRARTEFMKRALSESFEGFRMSRNDSNYSKKWITFNLIKI